jgi:Flp pilus assembly protein TadD
MPAADYDKLVALAAIYQGEGKWAQADSLLAEAARAAPGRPEAWALRGDSAFRAGDYPRAASGYQRSLEMKREQPVVLNNLAMAEIARGNGEAAYASVRQALAYSPQPVWPFLDTLARAQRLLGMRAEALATAREALGQAPPGGGAARRELEELIVSLGGTP